MSLTSSSLRVLLLPTRSVSRSRGRARLSRALPALLLVLIVVGCATIAPGNDPVVVNTERALRAADVVYKTAMQYYFAAGVAPKLSPPVTKIFECVRTGYDAPYKEVQEALDLYKLLRSVAARDRLLSKQRALADVLNAALPYLPNAPPAVEVP